MWAVPMVWSVEMKDRAVLCWAGLVLAPPPPARWWKYRGKIFVDENRNIWSDMEAMFDEVSIWEYYTTNIFPDWQSLLTISPIVEIFAEKCLQATSRLICHVWFWPYMVRQSTKLSLYMAYQSTNKCWASVPPQYHPSGPWGSLDQSQTWFTERKPVKKSRQTTNKNFAKEEYFLTLQEKFYYSVHMWAGTL